VSDEETLDTARGFEVQIPVGETERLGDEAAGSEKGERKTVVPSRSPSHTERNKSL